MKSKKVKPYVHSNRNAQPPSEAQMEADRAAAEAWAKEHGVKKLPPDIADFSTDPLRLFGRSTQLAPTFRG